VTPPQAGLRGSAHLTVQPADTAEALGSGDVPVLGTPRLVALIEAAAVGALRGHLDEGITSVGTAVDVQHLNATPVGATVHAEAVLQHADDRALRFEVRAWDDRGEVARGVHTRVLVDRQRFLARATGGQRPQQ
jgi:predicted thioesterase